MTTAFAAPDVEARGLVAGADARVKFAVLALASTLIFVWNNIWLQAAFLSAMVLLVLAAGLPFERLARTAAILLPAFVLITMIQGLWSPLGVTPIFLVPSGSPVLGGRTIFTVEGLVFGLVVCCRIMIPMLAFQYVFLTTDPNGVVLGLVRMGVPYRVAFLVSTTFRFVPLLLEEFGAIKDAQRLRGIDVDSFGIVRKLTAMGRMLVPLIVICLNKAQQMEIALQAKGFSDVPGRTYLNPGREKLQAGAWVVIFALGGVLAAAVAGRVLAGIGGRVL